MKFPRTGAVAVVLATGLALVLWWKWSGMEEGTEAGVARRTATKEAPPVELAPPASVPAPAPTRRQDAPAVAATGAITIELDLRGPDGAQLAAAIVHAQPESAGDATKRQRDPFDQCWRPDAAAMEFETPAAAPLWTLVAEAQSDPAPEAIACGDLVSDPVALDLRERIESPLVIRLRARRGLYGQVRGAALAGSGKLHAEVRWRALAGKESIGPSELLLGGHAATLQPCCDDLGNRMAGIAYVVHDLAPGRYVVGVRGDLGGPLESLCEVEVADAMVRQDLSLGAFDAATRLHAVVVGLDPEEVASIAFHWIGAASEPTRGDRMDARSDGPGSYWIAPNGDAGRVALKRVLDGALAPGETAVVTLTRDGASIAAQPLSNGQHSVVFSCVSPASLRIRFTADAARDAPTLRLALAPAAAAALLDAPPGMSHAAWFTGSLPPAAADAERAFTGLVPGDFILVTWGQQKSELRHGEVWWPLARRDVVVKSGDQDLVVDFPPLHPLTIRFDAARFGKDARVQAVLRSYPQWPLFAIPDENGSANFPSLPDGDYTVTVIGDMAGEKDFTLPGTSEIRVEAIRRGG